MKEKNISKKIYICVAIANACLINIFVKVIVIYIKIYLKI